MGLAYGLRLSCNREKRIKNPQLDARNEPSARSCAPRAALIAFALASCGTSANAGSYQPADDNILETRASAPTYLYRDKSGRAYALQLPGDGDDRLSRHYLSLDDFASLRGSGVHIGYLPEHPDDSVGPCTDADFPADFNLVYVDGVVYGNIGLCRTNSRPLGANTQVVDFVLFKGRNTGSRVRES